MKPYTILCLLYLVSSTIFAQKNIKVDQFGYLPHGTKIAIISKPDIGFNGGSTFTPGTGTNQYQLKKSSDNSVVYTGTITLWKAGATDTLSGDKGWVFDFSTFNIPGSYYIYDQVSTQSSNAFLIDTSVYTNVLKSVQRYYYYARCGESKLPAHAGSSWSDVACHIGAANQDIHCRNYLTPTDITSNKNVSGGWHDAGDYNKYVNFTFATLTDLLLAYKEHPTAFADNTNIPESGNGIADILDHIKIETDWLLKMQQANGSVLSVVGVQNFASASPPSTDVVQRLYGPATTSASFTTAAVLALASSVYSSIPSMATYANTLKTAAINAYTWASANPTVTFYNAGIIAAGEQEVSLYDTDVRHFAAAVYLYTITGTATYKTYVDNNYTNMHPIQWTYWYQFEQPLQDALLYYANASTTYLPTPAAKTAINSSFISSVTANNPQSLPAYTLHRNLYLAYMNPGDFTWGSHTFLANNAQLMQEPLTYNLNSVNHSLYKKAIEGYLHYYHGINPLDKVFISNMASFGAENSVNEFYHSWFGDGTNWDNVTTSLYGPPAGFLPSGVNPTYALDNCCSTSSCGAFNSMCNAALVTPPLAQPVQKSYKDFNTGWPVNSWTVTEVGIYTQAAYIRLLSNYVNAFYTTPLAIQGIELTIQSDETKANLYWNSASATIYTSMQLEKSIDGIHYYEIKNNCILENTFTDVAVYNNTTYFYRLVATKDGEKKYSNIVTYNNNQHTITVAPNPFIHTIHIDGIANNQKHEYVIVNTLGEKIQSGTLIHNTIETTTIKKGIYYLQLINKNKFITTKKIIKL